MSTIIFIGAVGRSGTTLIERAIATAPTAFALGEVVHLWKRGVRDNEPCGCGEPFHECPFWSAVGEHAFGGWDKVDLDAVLRDGRAVDRNRYIPLLLVPELAPRRFREALYRHTRTLDTLYAAISSVAVARHGAIVLVDSSKHPSYLFLLRRLSSARVLLLHVVRDPRGVACSWAKRVPRPESSSTTMERLGTLRASGRWISHNLLFQLASAFGVERSPLPYSTFTAAPRAVAAAADELLARVGLPPLGRALGIDGATVQLGVDHTVSGNPVRFAKGSITVRSDDAWSRTMPRVNRWIVTALTWPFWISLQRHGAGRRSRYGR